MVGSFYRAVLGYFGFGDSEQKSVRVDKKAKLQENKSPVVSPVVSGEMLTDENSFHFNLIHLNRVNIIISFLVL